MRLFTTLFTTLALSAAALFSAHAADKFITIGTGGVTGVYYPTGGAICRLVNMKRHDHGIRCSVESTGGSIYNLNALRDGQMDLAVAQSDWHYHAHRGTDVFEEAGAYDNLRSVFSLHTEPFTIIVRNDSGIRTLDDLEGKRVNIGNPGSGNRATMEVLMQKKGWTKRSFRVASELKSAEQAQALCDNKIDVMIYSAGHPNGAVQEVATSCGVKIIPVTGPEIDRLVSDSSFYVHSTIPGGMYAGNPSDIRTFGVTATFVTNNSVDEEVIYQVVKAVFDNFEDFKRLHPVFASLQKSDLVLGGNTAPLHRGSKRYFQEVGLVR